MLNTYNTRNVSEHVSVNKTVHEHRAPTDASIALFKEVEEKALKSVIDKIVINDNIFNFKIVKFKDFALDLIKVHYEFSLNGKVFNGIIKNGDAWLSDQDVLDTIYKKLADEIALQLVITLKR